MNKKFGIILIFILLFVSVFVAVNQTNVFASSPEYNVNTNIFLSDNGITYQGENVVVNGSMVEITSSGTYELTGSLSDGQVIVNSNDEEDVVMLFNGVSIHSTSNVPISVENAKNVFITLVDGTQNYLSDDSSNDDTFEPNATIFSNDDLEINGNGSLTIDANYNNGIASDDDLVIKSGVFIINAINNGIKGKDSLTIEGGVFNIIATDNGLESSNEEDGGSVLIKNGQFVINAGSDGIHSEGSIVINDGDFEISSYDDGIHADVSLEINGGDIDVLEAYEGLESMNITLNNGVVHVNTSDDGINCVSVFGSGGGQDDGSMVTINGGYLYIYAAGDGFDSNGQAVINDGLVIVHGPSDNKNGPLDVNGELIVNGGTLISIGSAGMPTTPSISSQQNSIAVVFDSALSAGTLISILDESGNSVVTVETMKTSQFFVFSSDDLTLNTKYQIVLNGEAIGVAVDSIYYDGVSSTGVTYVSLNLSSTVEVYGNISSQKSGGGGRGGK